MSVKNKKAKEYCEKIGKPVDLSILTNEGCWGGYSKMMNTIIITAQERKIIHNILMILLVQTLVLSGIYKITLTH